MTQLALKIAAAAALIALPLAAQKPPQVKSEKEGQAVQAIFQAPDPDARIAAVEELLQNFADTDFKSIALYVATASAQQKNDFEKMIIYGERTLQADPKHYGAMLIMAQALAQTTREHDLDKEEKLGRAEKLANDAGELLKTAPKMNPQLSDEDWETAKKDFQAQQHQALGMIATIRKKFDVAIDEFKTSVELNDDPANKVRLAQVYNMAGKHDEAIAVLDPVIAAPDTHPQIKQVAQAEKVRAVQAKGEKK